MARSISALIEAADRGEPSAVDTLFIALYSELHRIARHELARPGAPRSLGTTTVLHQAYIDLAGREERPFPDRNRFIGYAARVMRGVIIDYTRSRHAIKRGGQIEITAIDTAATETLAEEPELTSISEALDELAQVDPALALLVDLKFFCGFSFAEIAAIQGISERTVQRQWEKARIFLHQNIKMGLAP